MDPRDRADQALARARERRAYVVTPETAISPMDAQSTVQIPRVAVRAAESGERRDPESTVVLDPRQLASNPSNPTPWPPIPGQSGELSQQQHGSQHHGGQQFGTDQQVWPQQYWPGQPFGGQSPAAGQQQPGQQQPQQQGQQNAGGQAPGGGASHGGQFTTGQFHAGQFGTVQPLSPSQPVSPSQQPGHGQSAAHQPPTPPQR